MNTNTSHTANNLLFVNCDIYQPDGIADALISRLYQASILTEEDWLQFKLLFDCLYPGFISRLRVQFPWLTDGELRQTLFIKLNMSTRECAHMLGITVESIIKCRYRLKKKFNLSEDISLDGYVKRF